MICIVDNQNKIINIVNIPYPTAENERIYYPWCNLWEQYTEQEPLEYARCRKLLEVDGWTANKITGGFDSNSSGELVHYDSDKDTQLTMQGIALNVNTPLFDEKYPQGCPVRGYKYTVSKDSAKELIKDNNKEIFMLSSEQVMRWCADLSLHIGECKKQGWIKQAEVNKCTSIEELNKIVLE